MAHTMDFFEAQEAARRRTGLLVVLFGAAVLAIIAAVYLVALIGVGAGGVWFDPVLLLQVAFGVGIVISVGSAIRISSLRRGGPAVAELLGGRRVASDTSDPEERRLMNVVEEMSIASGVPVPAVYVLEAEDGINAFAAGHTIHDAAVAVTRGGLRALTRDELQGVIAHEFSHILNGDMRLNVRLMGVLYGILLLAVIGRGIVYAGPRGRSREGGSAGWVVLLGLALLLVGYIGVFFGKLIKAAVSRQREYLADSAAVQFTRNPDGLAGALKKIADSSHGSRIEDHHAEELSHLFFANGLRSGIAGMLSTHPPIDERIRRLDPAYLAKAGKPSPRAVGGSAPAEVAGVSGLVSAVGTMRPENLRHAASVLGHVPTELNRALHDPVEAKAVILALVASGAVTGEGEREILRAYGGDELIERVQQLVPQLREVGAEARLPLLDLALPALQSLSPSEGEHFLATVEAMVQADGRVRMFEFAVLHTLARRLGLREEPRGGRIRSFDSIRDEVEVVLSATAWAGSDRNPEAAAAAFAAGARVLPSPASSIRLRGADAVRLAEVDRALSALERTAPGVRRTFLEACAETISHDGVVKPLELEILRAVAECLDCPIPPLPGSAVGAAGRQT